MTGEGILWRQTLDVGCLIEISHTPERFGAHVHLDGEPEIGPGDRVRVYGDPIEVPRGAELRLRRRARIERATTLGRLIARLQGRLALRELYEVSFTERRMA